MDRDELESLKGQLEDVSNYLSDAVEFWPAGELTVAFDKLKDIEKAVNKRIDEIEEKINDLINSESDDE